ncbi:MAG: DNA polymerase III subunit delta [Saprospiraceae bacterium]|nr:DNA polymerase III subunit delta [Saprospiraceae bacterium]
MTAKSILSNLKSGQYAPIYLLHGEEPYYIDLITEYVEDKVLGEAEKAFNQAVLYGKDVDFKQVVDEARQFPMMATHRVIIIKEAQDMKTLTKLEKYAENPSPQSIVVIAYKHKKIDGRTKLAKNVSKKGILFESKKIYDNQLPGWITDACKSRKVSIDYEASVMLAEYLGTDLSKVSNEINKLLLNVKSNKITLADVQEQVGISKEYNVFEFQKALGTRNREKAFRIIEYFSDNVKSNPLPLILGNLYNYYSKLYITIHHLKSSDQQIQKLIGLPSPYFVGEYKSAAKNMGFTRIKSAFLALQRADLQSKGVGARSKDSKAILTELGLSLLYD